MPSNKILITGGTGSLGQALTKELLKRDIAEIHIYSRNEYLQWLMKQDFKDNRIKWLIGDVRDKNRLQECMQGINCVIHAAALKHVSTGENAPQEVIKTNIGGSNNVIEIAKELGIKKVMAISTDKSVNPSCLYGCTKSIMESLFLNAGFSCFRPGNFFESHGNVFEVWEKQAKEDGQVILTDERMTRYIMPIADIARIALNCLDVMEGGEIFIPKMKEYKIIDLCEAGIKKYTKATIQIKGADKGEKLKEILWKETEIPDDMGDYWVIKGG